MHRKHFRLLAEAFRRKREAIDEAETIAYFEKQFAHQIVDDLEDEICVVLNDANAEFSYQKFTDASGRQT